MERIVKGQPTVIEFGDYDNFAEMIPLELVQYRPDEYYKVCIKWGYPNSDRTINLWQQGTNVDLESFGVTV